MPEFAYASPFPLGPDDTRYRHLTAEHVSVGSFEGQEILKVAPEALTTLAREALRDVSFLYRAAHLEKVAAILDDPEASDNDRGVALTLLETPRSRRGCKLPDLPGHRHGDDRRQEGPARLDRRQGRGVALARRLRDLHEGEPALLADGRRSPCTRRRTRAPTCRRRSTSTPPTATRYEFLFVAKGGGSANKSYALPGDQGAAQPGEPREVPGREDAHARHGRLPAVPPGVRRSAAPRPRRR